MPLYLSTHLYNSRLGPVDEVALLADGDFEGDAGAFDDGDVVRHVSDRHVEGYGVVVRRHHIV